MKAKN
jgi:ubiquitin C-terminal hydrolase